MDSAETQQSIDGIAIVGMAGRFPGAGTVDELWSNLQQGVESISFFSDQELLDEGIDPALLDLPNYVKARGALGNAEFFDAAFFGHSPKVAELMDPQHRLFLECAWEALEHAGYDSERYAGRIGVYGGESMNTYLLNNLYAHIHMVASVDSLQAAIGNDKDSLTTEVSYKLNLRGPSVTIQTASSTSLVAVHQACQSLLNYECDMALAGGVSIHFPEKAGYLYQQGGATSPDGHCRAFDVNAQGFVNGHGAGVVALKRLEDALEDGDTIHAVIRGSAVNNDGSLKVSYMAPSVEGQAQVIGMAQTIAGVHPDTIGYVEAHGTGTNLGDPIEIAALTQAFRAHTQRKQYCALGSIKTNIGHLDTAAGVAGLIKATLTLKHRQIPPSLHYTAPNPQIDFAGSPFYVNTKLTEWPRNGTPRRAGVSSFGMGGTNAHVVLEEAPQAEPTDEGRAWQILSLSAKTSTALEAATTRLAAYLKQHPDLNLADVAYTLHLGRRPFSHRRVLVCQDLDDAVNALETWDAQRVLTGHHEPGERPVVLMFSGQGAQYVGMARELYEDEPVFHETIDRCAAILRPHLGTDLRDVLYPGADAAESATQRLTQTALAQPALFVIAYALAQQLMAWGVQPAAMVGHSIGEYVAACLAGVFSLDDALLLVAARGKLMQSLPSGAMLAVPLPEPEVQSLLGAELSLAAVNGPALCVVSGPTAAIDQLEAQLSAEGLNCRRLHTSHAFHSAMMEPILEAFAAQVRRIRLQAPTLPYLSNVSGTWITAAQATDPRYWTTHLRQAVRFADALHEILRPESTLPGAVLLEVGPGQTLSTLARQHPSKAPSQVVLASVRHPNDKLSDAAFLLSTLGKLWLAGVEVDWSAFYRDERRQRVPLPTYPFERQRYWVEPLTVAPAAVAAAPAATPQKKADLADWFYLPCWKPALPPVVSTEQHERWLLFTDASGIGVQLAHRIEQTGQPIVTVTTGSQFSKLRDRHYAIDPRQREDYDALLAELRALDLAPTALVHLWNVTMPDDLLSPADRIERALDVGFYSLIALAQALGAQDLAQPVRITMVTNNMQRVGGEPMLEPEKATALGPCNVIPQEYPHITCRSVDLLLPQPGSWHETRLLDHLLAECSASASDPLVAYRDHRRWVQDVAAVRLERPAEGASGLRPGGVYLITGGLGGIGLELAEHLARTVQAKLVLTSRSGLPPRDEWSRWLETHAATDGTSDKIRRVQSFEELGAEVLVLRADVADRDQMQAVIEQIDERFGALHGVIHAAGLVGRQFFRSIQETSADDCARQFKAKVDGTLALADVLRDRPIDVCMLLSSLSTVLGGLGFATYAASNLFMDAFAHQQSQHSPIPWIAVDWDAWQITVDQELQGRDDASQQAITLAEGMDAFERIVAQPAQPQVIVSTGDLRARIDQWIKLEPLHDETTAAPPLDSTLYPRPSLQNAYVAPRNETEQTIARIWQESLRIEQVGIHDNFFDLGGNSLSGIQIINQLRKTFDVQIPTVSLYEGPTVSALAQIINPAPDDRPQYEASRSRGERRREKRRERR
ncbi:MAG TPA: SDR family NAD(P)-dependent oxidoreductase [Herpetosiphonaceae bacterium]